MKAFLLFISIFIFVSGLFPDAAEGDYRVYHRVFAQIETLIANEQFEEAESELRKLFDAYEVKFAKDYVVAAQVGLMTGHRREALTYLGQAVRMGVKSDCLRKIGFLRDRLDESAWKQLEERSGELRRTYLTGIDFGLHQEFNKRYQREQDTKTTERYKTVVSSNFRRIKTIFEERGFPGETLVGLDNERIAPSISECECGNSKIIVTLLHYDYPVSELGMEKLISAIELGNLHPREFASIYTFERNRVSVLYDGFKQLEPSDKSYPPLPNYEFNFPFGKISADTVRVNADRQLFGIRSIETEEKLAAVSREYGIKLEFGYR